MHFQKKNQVEAGKKKHIGIVTELNSEGDVTIKIERDKCEGCRLGEYCNVSSSDELKVVVDSTLVKELSVGTKVEIEETDDMEVEAIWLCLVLPCILFIMVVVGISVIISTLAGCIAGLLSLVAYFGLYYLFGKKNTKNRINYKVNKL